jgi:hypothetical protein
MIRSITDEGNPYEDELIDNRSIHNQNHKERN